MVHCYDEWTKLKEIVLADITNDNNDVDFTFKAFYTLSKNYKPGLLKTYDKYILERAKCLNILEKTLIENDIKVNKVNKVDKIQEFNTPNFKSYTRPCGNPRDLFLILGDTIIEMMSCIRQRYFEFELLNDIFLEHFNSGSKWLVMPRSKLNLKEFKEFSETSFETWDKKIEKISKINFPMIDGACIYKIGKDILVNTTYDTNHHQAFTWLQRQFPEYRWHKVHIGEDHLDGEFVIIRPGLILYNPNGVNLNYDSLPTFMKNWTFLPNLDWEKPKDSYKCDNMLLKTTPRTEINGLVIEENKIIISKNATDTIKVLEKHNVDVIAIEFFYDHIFGGGIHCSTLDLIREGGLEDYS